MIVGIGTDIVSVERIRAAIERHGERFLQKIFTPAEVEYCGARRRKFEHLAGRFAAKEAVLKALGTGASGGATLKDVEVTSDAAGRPAATLHGDTLRLAREQGITGLHVSISHVEEFATAVAVAEV